MTDSSMAYKNLCSYLKNGKKRFYRRQQTRMSEEMKDTMTAINDFYCRRHLVLNLQDCVSAALTEWEQVKSATGKQGREKHLQ